MVQVGVTDTCNVLELKAANLAIRIFTKERQVQAVHIKMDNSYLAKMETIRNINLIKLSK